MRATVKMIKSGKGYDDKQRRIRLAFEDGEFAYSELEVKESVLGLMHVELDMVLDIEIEEAVTITPNEVEF